MPFINVKLNSILTEDKEKNIKEKLGKAISILPGKSESVLMINFEDKCRMYFHGNKQPMAYVGVNLFKKSPQSAYDEFTKEVTKILQDELHIDPSEIFIKYSETENWGWQGKNL